MSLPSCGSACRMAMSASRRRRSLRFVRGHDLDVERRRPCIQCPHDGRHERGAEEIARRQFHAPFDGVAHARRGERDAQRSLSHRADLGDDALATRREYEAAAHAFEQDHPQFVFEGRDLPSYRGLRRSERARSRRQRAVLGRRQQGACPVPVELRSRVVHVSRAARKGASILPGTTRSDLAWPRRLRARLR